jgi:hypothetical protein
MGNAAAVSHAPAAQQPPSPAALQRQRLPQGPQLAPRAVRGGAAQATVPAGAGRGLGRERRAGGRRGRAGGRRGRRGASLSRHGVALTGGRGLETSGCRASAAGKTTHRPIWPALWTDSGTAECCRCYEQPLFITAAGDASGLSSCRSSLSAAALARFAVRAAVCCSSRCQASAWARGTKASMSISWLCAPRHIQAFSRFAQKFLVPTGLWHPRSRQRQSSAYCDGNGIARPNVKCKQQLGGILADSPCGGTSASVTGKAPGTAARPATPQPVHIAHHPPTDELGSQSFHSASAPDRTGGLPIPRSLGQRRGQHAAAAGPTTQMAARRARGSATAAKRAVVRVLNTRSLSPGNRWPKRPS